MSEEELAVIGKLDPTGQPVAEVLRILRCIMTECLEGGVKQSDIPIDKPLIYLGMDSAQSIHLQVSI